MRNWKNKVLAIVFMLVFAFALAACNSSDDLEGTYIVEGGSMPGVSITFTGDNFRFVLPYSEIDADFDLPGEFVFAGTFSIDNRNSLINFTIDENALRGSVETMIDEIMDYMFTSDPEIAEMMQDPEFAALMMEYIDAEMDAMFDEMMDEMMAEMDNLTLRFERNFDRLFDDEADLVFIPR